MKETDAAWLAGIIDGEASVVVHPNRSSNKGKIVGPDIGCREYGRVMIYNTDLLIIEKVQRLIGVRARLERPRIDKFGTKPCYRISVSSQATLDYVLKNTLPYLTAKKAAAERILKIHTMKMTPEYLEKLHRRRSDAMRRGWQKRRQISITLEKLQP